MIWNPLSKVDPAKITSAFPLLALCVILLAIICMNRVFEAWQLVMLGLAIPTCGLIGVYLNARQPPPAPTPFTDGIEKVLLTSLAEKSRLPMYLMDADMTIRYCNNSLCTFIGRGRGDLVGKSIEEFVRYLSLLVPSSRRKNFIAEQNAIIKSWKLTGAFDAQVTEHFAREVLPGTDDPRTFEVWIYAHKMFCPETGKVVGTFVLYRPEPVSTNA